MEAPVAEPIQDFDAVVDFVEFPEERDAVEEDVDGPLGEVRSDEEQGKLQPEVGAGDEADGEDAVRIEERQEADGEEAGEEAEVFAVEDEVEEVREESPPDQRARFAGSAAFPGDEEEGEAEQPDRVDHRPIVYTRQPLRDYNGMNGGWALSSLFALANFRSLRNR
jgi:hypothetical protein